MLKKIRKIFFSVIITCLFTYSGSVLAASCSGSDGTTIRTGTCEANCASGYISLSSNTCFSTTESKCCASASTNATCYANNYYQISVKGTCGASCGSGYAALTSSDCISGKSCCVQSNTGSSCNGTTSAGETVSGTCKEGCSSGQVTLSNSSCTTGKCCFSVSSTACSGTCEATCSSGYKENTSRQCNDSSKKCCEVSTATNENSNSNSGSNSSGDISFENPLQYDNIQEFVTTVFNSDSLRNLAATIAVILIIVGGIMYMVSGGNEETIKKARKIITGAVVGLAIVLSAEAIMNTVGQILGWDGYASNSNSSISSIILNILTFLLQISGIIAIISLVIGGGMYMSASVSEKNAEKAKEIVQNSIIGIIVILSALVIINQIKNLIGS